MKFGKRADVLGSISKKKKRKSIIEKKKDQTERSIRQVCIVVWGKKKKHQGEDSKKGTLEREKS